MVQVPLLEEKQRRQVHAMTARGWIVLCICLVFIGFQVGWAARAQDTTDRYIQSQTAKNAAATTYFETKLDQMIQENGRIYNHGK